MKHIYLKILVSTLLALVFLFNQNIPAAQKDTLIKKTDQPPLKQKAPASKKAPQKKLQERIKKDSGTSQPKPKGPGDPDLEAEITRLIPRSGGRIEIQGKITNVGQGDFISGQGQAAGQVVVHLVGSSGPSAWPVLAQVPINRLNTGQSVSLRATHSIAEFLNWGHAPETSNECQAQLNVEFIVQVSYDPDIHMDGNENNDDCNPDNDQDRQSSMDIPEVRDYMTNCLE